MRRPIPDLIAELRRLDEHERIEAKTGLGKESFRTISAFANEPGMRGGYLLFGVGPEADHPIVGVAEPDKLSADLASRCASETFNRPVRPEIWVDEVEGKPVIAAYVAELPADDKPLYLRSQGLPRGAFRRIGSTDQHGTDEDLARWRELASDRPYEDTIVADATLEDIDRRVVALYRKTLLDANPASEIRDLELADLIWSLGGCREDGDGVVRPTAAGMLLFGSPAALRRLLPMARIEYLRVDGTEWVPSAADRFETVLEVREPLFVAFRRIYQAVLDDLPRAMRFPANEPQRQEDTAIPARVLREALVNAISHRSYRIHQPIQVLRYRNRIEIRNPGHSLVEEDRLGQPGSRARNPRIADVFREMRLAENKGTGIAVMRREMQTAHLSPPTFQSDREHDAFTATMLFHHLLGDADRRWLARYRDYKLADEAAMALVLAREKARVQNSDLRDVAGLETLAASKLLQHLRDSGLLEQRGSGAATYYALVEIGAPEAPATDSASGEPVQLGLPSIERSRAARGGDANRGVPGGRNGGAPGGNGGVQDENGGVPGPVELPEDLRRDLAALPKRPSNAALRDVIRRLCSIKAMKPGEIAAHLSRRSVKHLVEKHLNPMVRDGVLERTHPNVLAHPKQAYRAKPKRTE